MLGQVTRKWLETQHQCSPVCQSYVQEPVGPENKEGVTLQKQCEKLVEFIKIEKKWLNFERVGEIGKAAGNVNVLQPQIQGNCEGLGTILRK